MAAAPAAAFKPAVLFESSAIEESGFNRSALNGAQAFSNQTGTDVAILAPQDGVVASTDVTLRLTQDAIDAGHDPLVGIGSGFTDAFQALAPRNPDVHFVLIDSVVDGANVRSVIFREEEGSLLVGVIAALVSETSTIAFVGSQDDPQIRSFGCGFVQGARLINPNIVVRVGMVGDTPKAWYDPEKGAEIANALMAEGADVVYHAAGGSGNGVIGAAAAAGKLAIGVDSNQNGQAPGHVLTSMLKRLDVAVYLALSEIAEGRWTFGTRRLGLHDGGVDWALDEHNIGLISQIAHDRVDSIAFDVLAGRLEVARYNPDTGCPGFDFDAALAAGP